MIARARQRGASTLLILLIMVLLLVAFFAAYTLSRVASGGDERNDTLQRLSAAAAALERYAAANMRLPCPADGAANTGLEVLDDVDPATKCKFSDTGTVPWLTLGLSRDAGLDAWGRKISYRVYTGNAGSLTQAGGTSMVECDLVDPAVPPAAKTATGLCVPNADPLLRSTTAATFLNGKGLRLNDYGINRTDVAYVLISHGATGGGGWTVAGTMLPLPGGDELKNTQGDNFVARAFSDPDDADKPNRHFDDLLAFATLPDLVKRTGLEARDWPDIATSSVTFDSSSVSAAAGQTITSGDVGAATLDFGSATVSGFSTGGAATNISLDPNSSGTATDGIGVVRAADSWLPGSLSNLMSNYGNEYIRIQFSQPGGQFAVTLNNFGTYVAGETFTEQVQFKFYLANILVGSAITKGGCHADGGLASFTMTPAGPFDAVEIIPVAATGSAGGTSYTGLLVSEIKACTASTATCKTGLATGANTCP